jgi:hypothetical protein
MRNQTPNISDQLGRLLTRNFPLLTGAIMLMTLLISSALPETRPQVRVKEGLIQLNTLIIRTFRSVSRRNGTMLQKPLAVRSYVSGQISGPRIRRRTVDR